MDKKQLGKKGMKVNATRPDMKKVLRTSKDAVEKPRFTLVESDVKPNVLIKDRLATGWNATAHTVTIVKNVALKAIVPVAIADYAVQAINAWEHGAKMFAGISDGFAAIMNQVKPLIAWGAGHTWGVVAIVVGYIALSRALKFRFKSSTEPSTEQK